MNDTDSVILWYVLLEFCGDVFDTESVNHIDSVRFIGAVFETESVNDIDSVRFCGT